MFDQAFAAPKLTFTYFLETFKSSLFLLSFCCQQVLEITGRLYLRLNLQKIEPESFPLGMIRAFTFSRIALISI